MPNKKKKNKLLVACCIVILVVLLCPLSLVIAGEAGVPFPIYGNCCNLNYTNNGTPIDFLDAQCEKYNERYEKNGGFDPQAAQEFIDTVSPKLATMSGSQKNVARVVVPFFKFRMTVFNLSGL